MAEEMGGGSADRNSISKASLGGQNGLSPHRPDSQTTTCSEEAARVCWLVCIWTRKTLGTPRLPSWGSMHTDPVRPQPKFGQWVSSATTFQGGVEEGDVMRAPWKLEATPGTENFRAL
ncbi:hypothetical protein MRX96_002458 [Rhipicephalus microplus]